MTKLLFFSKGNAKLDKTTLLFSLPAGFTCPFAKICKSFSNRKTGKVTDGQHTQFRCYATQAEILFKNVRESRWQNLELLKQSKTVLGMAHLIEKSISIHRNISLIRFHQSGDFFSQEYFDAWLLTARMHPEWIFYGYTKALPFWIKRLQTIPSNFRLVASVGGTQDSLIDMFGLRCARVVFTEKAAEDLNLEIDHDDSHVWNYDKDFAILLHGTQPAGTPAGKAWQIIKTQGKGGYKSDYFKHYQKSGKGKKTWDKPRAVPVLKVSSKPFQVLSPRWFRQAKWNFTNKVSL